jgi:hypothetical protein
MTTGGLLVRLTAVGGEGESVRMYRTNRRSGCGGGSGRE